MDGCQFPTGSHRYLVTANEQTVLHDGVVILACQMANLGKVLFGGHEEDQIAWKYLLVTIRADGLAVTFNRHHVEVVTMCHTDFLQGVSHQLIVLVADFLLIDGVCIVHLHAEQEQFTIVELPELSHPTVARTGGDVFRSQQFWIYERLDSHVLKQFQVLGLHVFVVVHTCHRLLGSQLLGEHGASQVLAFVGGDGNEEVGLADPGIFHAADRGGLPQ